jgi:hypothetical protein
MKKLEYTGGGEVKINLPSGNYKVGKEKKILTLSDQEAEIIMAKNRETFREVVKEIRKKFKSGKKKYRRKK